MADEIDALVDELYGKGLLDDQFIAHYELKPDNGSMYFIKLVQTFHEDIQSAMTVLAIALEHLAVDYTEINEHYVKIKRIARSIGASALNQPFEVLRLGVAASFKEECNFALLRIDQEYQKLSPHLESITEVADKPLLERRIVDLERNLAGLADD